MEKLIEIFLCYAHEDEELCLNLEKQLRALKRQGLIDVWYDRQIPAGTEWEGEINKHLNTAQIILLLISPDFMASDYCYGFEMERAMERHQCGEACVIPVILRPTLWQGALFGKLQALPTDAIPVLSKEWQNQDEAFFDIAEGIKRVIEDPISSTKGENKEVIEGAQGLITQVNQLQPSARDKYHLEITGTVHNITQGDYNTITQTFGETSRE